MIYYVEDDNNIRELVVYTLNQMNLPALGYADSQSFWQAMAQLPDLILLDIMLPQEDGMAILRRLRGDSRTANIPVVMVTAKGGEADKVQGLDAGADDYIAKPFGMAELVARVRARLRRTAAQDNQKLVSGTLVMDKRAHTVSVDGHMISLTLKEYDLLCLLMENKGMAFSRERLLERIWEYDYDGGTRTVDVHVRTLRNKLGACGAMIETVRGVGYRFGGQ